MGLHVDTTANFSSYNIGNNEKTIKKQKGRGGAILTPNELVLTFGGLHVCVQFGENRRRNATVRVSTEEHTHTHAQTQNDFIICPMLYAIAMGQINRNVVAMEE